MNVSAFLSRTADARSTLVAMLVMALVQVSAVVVFYFTGAAFNLLAFDAEIYEYLQGHGYSEQEYLTAFFPLFPAMWGWLGVSPAVISGVNFLLWFAVLFFASRALRLSVLETLLIQVLPSMIFMGLPYSESVFAVASLVILIGLKRQQLAVSSVGFFLANISRPAGSIFIPAVILMELLTAGTWGQKLKRITIHVSANAAGLLCTAWIQSWYDWPWFTYFRAQRLWGNELQFPSYPLTSWGGDWNARFDGIVLFTVLLMGGWMVLRFLRSRKIDYDRDVLFSMLYVFGITASVLLFRGGSLFSLNRFVFATLIGGYALVQFFRLTDWRKKDLFVVFGISMVFHALGFKSFNHIQNLLGYSLFSVMLLFVLIAFTKNPWSKWIGPAGLLFLLAAQLFCYSLFLNDHWIA